MRYVCGFLFNHMSEEVALIRKNRPTWQAGRLNGIGSKIDIGETPDEAMRREFREETSADIDRWEKFCILQGSVDHRTGGNDPWQIHFYRAFTSHALNDILQTVTDEEIVYCHCKFPTGVSCLHRCLPNLSWLIPMAINMDLDRANLFTITEQY